MSQNDSTREVACTLTEDEDAERSEKVQSLLINHFAGYEKRENGVDIRFDGADESLRAVAQFTSNELQCCSFAEYNINVSPPFEETVLTITGPDGTRQMFVEGLAERLEEEAA